MARIYDKQRWRRLRRRKLSANPLCEECLPRAVVATQVDHIVAINAGGNPWDWHNLRSLCATHHSRKTQYIEVQGRDRAPVKGVDPATGRPIDPAHWWNS